MHMKPQSRTQSPLALWSAGGCHVGTVYVSIHNVPTQESLWRISHFTVAYSVTQPMNGSEAAGFSDLAVFIM